MKDWTEVTAEHQLLGEGLIRAGKVVFVVRADERSLRVLPGMGLTLLGWKLLQAGNVPVWVIAVAELTERLHAHILELGLPPGMQGSVFSDLDWDEVLAANTSIEHMYVCECSNVLADLHPGILGMHAEARVLRTFEASDGTLTGPWYHSLSVLQEDLTDLVVDLPDDRCFKVTDDAALVEAARVLQTFRFKP
jgi:hypothetical protein